MANFVSKFLPKESKMTVSTNKRRPRESLPAKIAHFLGAILQILLIALPKDLCRWLCMRRKCVAGQTVVITGGASGIGQRLAEIFACKLGARVAILDANLDGANRVVEGIMKAGGQQARAWQCDIADGERMRQCVEEIHKYFGRVDIVICNAAILYFASTLELKDAEIQRAMNVNLLGTINTIRAFLPQMEAQGRGQIVAISSIAGFFGETFGMAYCPTKFAVRGAMECLRMELRDRGLEHCIHCTTICPFFVRTPMILNRGIRPISRWIPFMSIERCATQIVDAVLKEKVLAFIPPWLCLLTAINSFLSLNMQRIARDFINCRYEELGEEERTNNSEENGGENREKMNEEKLAKDSSSTNGPIMENGGLNRGKRKSLRELGQMAMRDYFKLAHPIWWVLIPPGMLLTFLTSYNPELVNVPWLSLLGQFAYYMGTEHPQVMLWINIFAWAWHLFAAIWALYLVDSLHLSHKCAFLWFIQTFILGLPSLLMLFKFQRKNG